MRGAASCHGERASGVANGRLLCHMSYMEAVYRIKRTLVAPMLLAVVLSIPVFVDVFRRGYQTRIIVMASLLMILFYLFALNNVLKRVKVNENGLFLRGLFGTTAAPFDKITRIDGIRLGSRQFIAITAHKHILVPNSFERFEELIDDIVARAPQGAVAGGIEDMRKNIVKRTSDVTMAWIVVILLALCNIILFFPHVIKI